MSTSNVNVELEVSSENHYLVNAMKGEFARMGKVLSELTDRIERIEENNGRQNGRRGGNRRGNVRQNGGRREVEEVDSDSDEEEERGNRGDRRNKDEEDDDIGNIKAYVLNLKRS